MYNAFIVINAIIKFCFITLEIKSNFKNYFEDWLKWYLKDKLALYYTITTHTMSFEYEYCLQFKTERALDIDLGTTKHSLNIHYYLRMKRTHLRWGFFSLKQGEKRGKRGEETISSLAWMVTCFRGQVTSRTRGRENPKTHEPRAMTSGTHRRAPRNE